jgi:hypothetical protein
MAAGPTDFRGVEAIGRANMMAITYPNKKVNTYM